MTVGQTNPDAESKPAPGRLALIVLSLFSVVILALVYFVVAGRIDLPIVWAYLGYYGCIAIVTAWRIDVDLVHERTSPGPGAHDVFGVYAMKVLGFVHFGVAAVDARFQWSPTVPSIAQFVGLVAFAIGFGVVTKCMIANRYFSSVVRLQTERGHELITTGPYRWVRHPGYAGAILGLLGSPLALNSWWSGVPAVAFVAVLLRRTKLEDRFLHAEMPAYEGFAKRVRWRLLPWIW